MPLAGAHCTIVPPHLLDRLARGADLALRAPARQTLQLDADWRNRRRFRTPRGPAPGGRAPRARTPGEVLRPDRIVHDAEGGRTLPGTRLRSEGEEPVGDAAVDRAYDGLGATFALFADVWSRDSVDGAGLPLSGTVHYGRRYANAFWDGGRMVFGDGDGVVFNDFTLAVDVIGHELSHGVVQYTADLAYEGQSGALNESVSDVFGSLVKQRVLGQSAAEADWLIGAELFTDRVNGRALRSLAEPGTAYDDDTLGRDPQPAHMDDYVRTNADNGGVHINSGIPNRAFHLTATALGGRAWERAGQVWYDALTAGGLRPDAGFGDFAAATTEAASSRYGRGDEYRAVREAWRRVGVPR